jgi:hypothetical protein
VSTNPASVLRERFNTAPARELGATGAHPPALSPRHRPSPPVLALSIEDACQALGVSWRTWRQYVEPNVRIVRMGRSKRVSVAELQRYLDARGERIGADVVHRRR